jgi:rhodanese-related sulfurtransferase
MFSIRNIRSTALGRGRISYGMHGMHGILNEISTTALKIALSQGAPPVLIEALPLASYEKEHLPGAINIPLDGFEARARALLPNQRAELVVYCSGPTCPNSHAAARKLGELGYENVRVYSGGKAAWREAGLAFETARLTA